MDGGIKFDVSANTAKFDADMGRVKNSASGAATSVSNAFRGLGSLLAGGAIVGALQSILGKFDDISDMAKRFGTTAVDIQKVGNAAQLVGTDIDAVARAMTKAGVSANKAAREGGALAEAFARVSIDPAKFAAAGLEERVKMVAEAQRAANGDAQKMADIYEVVGAKAAGINFAELADEMANVSAASNETVEALAQANDQLDVMKQNATIFGANLLSGIVQASERIGNLIGSGFTAPPETNAEADARQMRENARNRLIQRGELLPDDSTIRNSRIPLGVGTPAGAAYAPEVVPGPNAKENERRIDAEVKAEEERIKAQEAAARAAREAAASEAEQTSNADEKAKAEADVAKFKQYILDLELQIKEAQAAGDSQKAESVGRLKDWTEAAIKYEGDLDMAARDVNASLKERLRLKEGELAKQQQSIEAELQYAETMAFGTEEAKSKAEWMRIYNEQIARGASEDQARRSANAGTYKKPNNETLHVGSGGGNYSFQQEATFEQRLGAMRGEALGAASSAAAQRFQNAGMFRSAVRAQDRAQRAKDRAMQRARMKDINGGKNIGEAYEDYIKSTGLDRMSRKQFEDDLRDQATTPEERARAEQASKRSKEGKEGGKSSDPMQAVTDIYKLLTERLPIHVLAA